MEYLNSLGVIIVFFLVRFFALIQPEIEYSGELQVANYFYERILLICMIKWKDAFLKRYKNLKKTPENLEDARGQPNTSSAAVYPPPDLFSEEIQECCREEAKRYGVPQDIHRDDFIYHFIMTNPYFHSAAEAVHYYFSDGNNSAAQLSALLRDVIKFEIDEPFNLMEFASGYGCVTRHIPLFLPHARLMSCDIHEEAVRFIQSRLSIPGILSHSVPEMVEFPKTYDVVFALSFFSHMPPSTWGRWLRRLYVSLNSPGYLIFTTHGRESMRYFPNIELPSNGFYFKCESEQKDLTTCEYGTALTLPDWVIPEIHRQVKAPIAYYRCGYWWGHQDVYILEKGSCS